RTEIPCPLWRTGMTNCWSEGALRAYLDRELPAEDMKSVAAHLGECSSCDALCAELAGRAARVFALIETLPKPELVVRAQPAAGCGVGVGARCGCPGHRAGRWRVSNSTEKKTHPPPPCRWHMSPSRSRPK